MQELDKRDPRRMRDKEEEYGRREKGKGKKGKKGKKGAGAEKKFSPTEKSLRRTPSVYDLLYWQLFRSRLKCRSLALSLAMGVRRQMV